MADNPFSEFDLNTMMSNMQLQNVDLEGLMEIYRKNMEAIAEVNQAAAEGLQELAQAQAKIMEESLTELIDGVTSASTSAPQDRLNQQSEMARSVFETTYGNLRAVGEKAMKTNSDVFDIINKRMMASMEELKDLSDK